MEKKMIEWIPLINISYAIKSFMEMLQVVKYFTHKFNPDKQGELGTYYYKLLKFGLYHFARI